jgi:hypothetical protein
MIDRQRGGGGGDHVADDRHELLNDLHRTPVNQVALGHFSLRHLAHKVCQHLQTQDHHHDF